MIKRFIVLILILTITLPVFSAEKPRWVAQPVYVYIPDNYGNYSRLMQQAFMEWEEKSDSLVRFKYTTRPSEADISVQFVDFT